LAAVEKLAAPGLGRELTAHLLDDLRNGARASAATHHGVESYPELAQGNLLFALAEIRRSLDHEPFAPILVLACENAPLNSATCPGGFLFGRRRQGDRYQKIHLFKRSSDRVIVGRAPSLTREDLNLFLTRVDQADLQPFEKTGLKKIVGPLASDALFLGASSFLDQAARLNRRLWNQRFKGEKFPALAFLSLEGLASECLIQDLAEADSLVSRLIFDQSAFDYVLKKLRGLSGCWHESLLSLPDGAIPSDRSRPLGTVLFWEINAVGQSSPMGLTMKKGQPALTGSALSLALRPEELISALTERKILPGLFLCFATLVLGHGLRTYGGVYMVDYLPRMLAPALEVCPPPRPVDLSWSSSLAAGLLPIQLDSGRPGWEGLYPAGAVELAAAGPLETDFFERLMALKLSDISPFSASEWCLEETRPEHRARHWAENLESLRRASGGLRLSLT
jgi:hypothetical protein